jgi:sigma-B regulation protein RsbU (phosphoserine phosphatase)
MAKARESMIGETGHGTMAEAATTGIYGFPEPRRVLVAEDQDDVIAALRLLLKNSGYDAQFVKSPEEALSTLRGNSFDAVLLDLNYSRDTTSGSEGLELISQVLAHDSTLAVVVMTAWGSIDLAVKAMHRGAGDFVQKPWDNRRLLQVLDQQMRRSQDLRHKRFRDQLEQQEAAQIQRALMPGEIATHDGLTIAAASQSARTVGGDYYDVIRLGEHSSALCIADVVGKGVGAALLMSNLQAAVRTLAPEVMEPGPFCQRVNKIVLANNVPGKFITFFYCVVDMGEEQRIRYTNAGHAWPILGRADGSCQRLSSEDVVLGTMHNWDYHQQETTIRKGDRLVLFTDGITECLNAADAEFGEEHLIELVTQNVHLSAVELRDTIFEAARQHCNDALSDDATLIVLAAD